MCLIATLGFTCRCLYKYYLDEDVSQVTYQDFHKTKEGIYPSVTLCFSTIFFEENLKIYGDGINVSTYTDYLFGNYWDARMSEVDYDNVTIDIKDYFLGTMIYTPDWRHLYGDKFFQYDARKKNTFEGKVNELDKSMNTQWKPNVYVSYRGPDRKCMSVDIPYVPDEKVWTFGILFGSDIFPNGTRPDFYDFGIKLHYPRQFLRSNVQKYVWKSHENYQYGGYTMKFTVQKMEVLRKRNRRNAQCNENWKNDDVNIMNVNMKNNGCRHPHWKAAAGTLESTPRCATKEQMKYATEFQLSKYMLPCQSVKRILYIYDEYDTLLDQLDFINNTLGVFETMLEFLDNSYLEIRQVKAYDIQSLVGDVGGYIGLFLGFALLQTPELMFNIYRWIKHLLLETKGENNQTDASQIDSNGSENNLSTIVELSNVDCI